MSAPKENNNAMKYKTRESRRTICLCYCDHVSSGFSKSSFPLCDDDTIRRYRNSFPDDFPDDMIEEAFRKGRLLWEKVGISITLGSPARGSAGSWILQMKNRYGWRHR